MGTERWTLDAGPRTLDYFALANSAQQERLTRDLEVDVAWQIPEVGRCRASIFRQRGTTGLALRLIPAKVPPLETLLLPRSESPMRFPADPLNRAKPRVPRMSLPPARPRPLGLTRVSRPPGRIRPPAGRLAATGCLAGLLLLQSHPVFQPPRLEGWVGPLRPAASEVRPVS